MLLCFSSSHRTADFDLLERLERHAPAITAALAEHSDIVSGSVVLATCNRFEAYLDIDEPLPAARAVSAEAVFSTRYDCTEVDVEALHSTAHDGPPSTVLTRAPSPAPGWFTVTE